METIYIDLDRWTMFNAMAKQNYLAVRFTISMGKVIVYTN